MKVIFCIAWIMGMLFFGCSEPVKTDKVESGGSGRFVFSVVSNGEIDSAQVFFFRKRLTKDTLIHREVIKGITETPTAFTFELPAGYYTVSIYANVSTNNIVASPPYAPENILLDYSHGEEHPMIYWGQRDVNIGVDQSIASAMLEITSYVQLTIKNVPEGVDHIDVELFDTGAGVYLNRTTWKELTSPNLKQSVYNVKADSTYVVSFACFPTIESIRLSFMDVNCYDKEGVVVYRGVSENFSAISRSYITCSFKTENARTLSRDGKNKHNVIHWEYGKGND